MGVIINKELILMTEITNEKVYFPILVSISDRKCLIIGGGPIALHKVQSLEKFTSNITILSPSVTEKLQQMADKNGYKIITKEYETSDLDGFELVIAATGKKVLSKKIWKECKERKILINAVDDPEHCDFILPATIKRGDLTVSIGTQGKSPFMTKEIRRWMNRMFTPEWSEVVDLAADYRKQVFEKYSPKHVHKIILTCSGGPFFGCTKSQLQRVTPAQALKNPNWDMGNKILIESATLFNKGFELIEAHHLFNCPITKLDAIIDRKSYIHAIVEFKDAPTQALAYKPDMKIVIEDTLLDFYHKQNQTNFKNRKLKFITGPSLTSYPFKRINHRSFPAIQRVLKAHRQGTTKTLYKQTEKNIGEFLKGRLPFTQI